MCSTATLTETDRRRLTTLARDAIAYGLDHGSRPTPGWQDWPARLREKRASFVTLNLDDKLRGCVGNLSATRPLVADVATNAFSAAFQDSRFAPLSSDEFPVLGIHLSVLSAPESIRFAGPDELLARIRPGVDGLILYEGDRRSTFLPSVWHSLPEKEDFLRELKRKAGLPADYWSDSLRISRYTTQSW